MLGLEAFEEQLGLCMEFVHGDTLDAVVRAHGTLTQDEARLVGRDVCQALASVHREGFLHRDVKARNVMRDRMGRIVLMDFGTGISLDDAGRTDARFTAGTPMYMAPEVLAGEAPSVAADIYSVGVLLYYLVTGAYPVEGRSLPELSAAHMTDRRVALRERRPSVTFVTYRRGYSMVPGGFDADAFAAGSHDGPIDMEYVRTRAIFFNANAVIGAIVNHVRR